MPVLPPAGLGLQVTDDGSATDSFLRSRLDIAAAAVGNALLTSGWHEADENAPPSPSSPAPAGAASAKRKKKKASSSNPTNPPEPSKEASLELRVQGQRHTIRALEKALEQLKRECEEREEREGRERGERRARAKQGAAKAKGGGRSRSRSGGGRAPQPAAGPGDDSAYKSLLGKHSSLRAEHSKTLATLSSLRSSQTSLKAQLARVTKIADDMRAFNARLREESDLKDVKAERDALRAEVGGLQHACKLLRHQAGRIL
ncbi:hypothetical protein TeGR_g14223 [Tetraparma gracilis]|uniref:Uncharacterized protein n=1 Tax=Tetraparma gracilis TaxID=2962635 RepID=A0ABQ6MQH1_9STRA|nr:hypothetical protein TeGR_g14223 [Tetraparma gracilis]